MGPVYLNGEFVEAAEARVSAFDHGLLTGDGVFESVAIRRGRPFALTRHLKRLETSAAVIGITTPPLDELRRAAEGVAARAGCETGKIRITVTGGPGPLGSARGQAAPTVVVACEAVAPRLPDASVVVAPWPKNELSPIAGAKTTSYAENVVALAFAAERGASEAIWLNLAGNVCEGTGSNIFLGIEGELVTPPLSAGCLAGVTRGLIIEAAAAVVEREVAAAELAVVEEAFLSSTTRGVQPVATVDGRELAGCPGPLTSAAAAAFAQLVETGVE